MGRQIHSVSLATSAATGSFGVEKLSLEPGLSAGFDTACEVSTGFQL